MNSIVYVNAENDVLDAVTYKAKMMVNEMRVFLSE
jgi:hypothetical protein